MPIREEAAPILAAGAVLWRDSGAKPVEVAVVHRPRYDDWSLPKGKLDGAETMPAAAVREIAEETGFRSVLGPFLRQVRYSVTDRSGAMVPKVVDYFTARAVTGTFQPNDEVDELRWLPAAEAAELLSYPQDHEVVDSFRALPPHTTTLLLVRHAHAGDRSTWAGDDDLRPLSSKGWRQTKALRGLLPLFGADRVHSATRLRCEQTVQALAEDVGVAVHPEPLLTEEAYWAQRPAALLRLREIAAAGGTPVVSSQGGVIPDLVATLAVADGLELGEIASRKGSVWALSFAVADPAQASGDGRAPGAPRLVTAYYLPSPLAAQPQAD